MSCTTTSDRLVELKKNLDRLRREAESAISGIGSLISRGNSVFSYQKSIQDVELFLKTYPISDAELSYLMNKIMKLSCGLEIALAERSDISDAANSFENNDAVLCEENPRNRETVSSSNVSSQENITVGVCTENVSAPQNDIDEYCVTKIRNLYNLEKDSILEMKYLLGENPSEFWLGFYSDIELQSHLVAIKKKIRSGELHHLSAIPRIGQYIIGRVDTVFRGCVLSTCNKNIVAVDIDKGELKLVNEDDSWEVGDCLSHFPPQALLCKLSCMERGEEWYKCLSNMFKQCIEKCNLVVTVKDIIPGLIPVFVVDVDAHDNVLLDMNLNEWINSYVFPAIEKVKLDGLSDNVNESFFDDIIPFAIYEEDSASNSVCSSRESCTERNVSNSRVE